MSSVQPYFAPKHSYEAPTKIVIPQAHIDRFCVEKKKREVNGEAIEKICKQMTRYLTDLPFSQDAHFIASEWPKLIHAIKMLHYAKQRNALLLWPKASVDDTLAAEMKTLQIQDDSQEVESQEVQSQETQLEETQKQKPEDSLKKLEKDIRESIKKITSSHPDEAALDNVLYPQRRATLQSPSSDQATIAEIDCAFAVFKDVQEGFQAVGNAQSALLTYLDNPIDRLGLHDLQTAIEAYSELTEDPATGRFTQKLVKITKHLFETVIAKRGPKTVHLTDEEEAVWSDLLAQRDIDVQLLTSYADKKTLHTLYFTKERCDPFLEIVLVATKIDSVIISSYKSIHPFFGSDEEILGRFKELFALFPQIALQEERPSALQVYGDFCKTMADLANVANPTYRHKKLLEHAKALFMKANQDLANT